MGGENLALVADGRPLVACGIAQCLESQCGFMRADTAVSGPQCLQWIDHHGCPELIVLDSRLPDGAAINLIPRLTGRYPEVRLLVVSGDARSGIQESVRRAGAHGFLCKCATAETLARAVALLRLGQLHFPDTDCMRKDAASKGALPRRASTFGLTARQSEVLEMLLRGLSNKRIAKELALSEATIKEHVGGIFAKLKVGSRIELMVRIHGSDPGG